MFAHAPLLVDKSDTSGAASNEKVVDAILHSNQVLFELLPEITTND